MTIFVDRGQVRHFSKVLKVLTIWQKSTVNTCIYGAIKAFGTGLEVRMRKSSPTRSEETL
jgi:hypothetical protein